MCGKKFQETRKKRLPVKDVNLQDWALECSRNVSIIILIKIHVNTENLNLILCIVVLLDWFEQFRGIEFLDVQMEKRSQGGQ